MVTAKLISAFVFATRIVHFLFYLNPKVPVSSHLLCLYSPVCVGPVRQPHCWFSLEAAHFISRKNESEKIVTHMQSVLPQMTQKQAIQGLPSEWLFYEENTRASKLACVRTCTLVTPITIALFAGPTKLPPDALREEDLAVTLGR